MTKEIYQFILMATIAVITAIVVIIEHWWLGRVWAANEMARRVLGHATILAIVGAFVFLGYLDLMTWLAMAVATGVAGAIVGAMVVHEQEQRRANYLAQLRRWAEEQGDGADSEH